MESRTAAGGWRKRIDIVDNILSRSEFGRVVNGFRFQLQDWAYR